MSAPGALFSVRTSVGRVEVWVCTLCAALVLAVGRGQHEHTHAVALADQRPDDEPDPAAVAGDDAFVEALRRDRLPLADPLTAVMAAWVVETDRSET